MKLEKKDWMFLVMKYRLQKSGREIPRTWADVWCSAILANIELENVFSNIFEMPRGHGKRRKPLFLPSMKDSLQVQGYSHGKGMPF